MSSIYDGKPLPSGWLVYTTDDGRPYFHNRLLAATQWDPPVAGSAPPVGSSAGGSVGGILKDDDDNNDLGISDGDITGLRNSSRMVRLSDNDSRPLAGGKTGGQKKGYATLQEERSLAGMMDIESGRQQPLQSVEEGNSGKWLYCIDIRFLQSLFDIDTISVKDRILASMVPYQIIKEAAFNSNPSSSLSEETGIVALLRSTPDCYGPFWIPTTLALILFVLTNSAMFFAGKLEEANFSSLVVAFSMLYGYLFIVPTIGWALNLFLGRSEGRQPIAPMQLISVYGYSFSIALPVALLSLIPFTPLRWVWALVGSIVSLTFILANFKRYLVEADPTYKLSMLGLMVVAQISFYAAFPLYFFRV